MDDAKPCTNNRADVSARYYAANKDKILARQSAYRAEHPGKEKERSAKYRAANPESKKASTDKWAAANKDKIKAMNTTYIAAYPERKKASSAKYRKANPGKRIIYEQNRRAIKRDSGGNLSHGLASKLLKLQHGKCPCCNQPLGDDYHLDHIMPLALGGPNIDSNIQLLRQRCNNQKHAKHPIDFMQQRGFLL